MFGFFESKTFNPATDIPDLSGKTILVTGGNIGLGQATCLELARHKPAHIYLCARSAEKATKAMAEIQAAVPDAPISFLECDLTSFASITRAATDFHSQSSRLDVLFANAGIMAVPAGVTPEGYEIQFGTNHVGHALLIKLLLPTLLKTAEEPDADVRVVITSSTGHNLPAANGIDFDSLKSDQDALGRWRRYGQSKLANILYAKALARRYPSIKFVAVHPGLVATNLASSLTGGSVLYSGALSFVKLVPGLIKSPAEGAKNQLWAAFGDEADVVSGEYYEPVGVAGRGSKFSNDEALSEKLWEWTEKELAEHTT